MRTVPATRGPPLLYCSEMRTRPFSPAARVRPAPAFWLAAVGGLVLAACPGCQSGPGATGAPAPPAAGLPMSDAEGVQRCLDGMGKAVAAGDSDGYLGHIARRSAFFLVEQREWAKDLTRAETRPASFTAKATGPGASATQKLTLVGADGKPAPTDVEVWTGPVRFEWEMPTAGPAKLPSSKTAVEFEARFYRAPEDGAWRYAGEALETLESPNAVIYYPKGAERAARHIAEGFPAAKKHDDEFFGKNIDRVEEIRLYDRRDVLQFSVYPSMFQTDTTLSGWSEAGQSIKFMTTYARDVRGWTAAFAHEYGHVATWEMGEKASAMPWWVQEGVAEMAAEAFTGGRGRIDKVMVRWAKDKKLAEWMQISDYRTTDQGMRLHPYHQGHHMVGFVSDTFGAEKRIAWLQKMADGADVEKATAKVLGLTFAELDAKWREHVAGLVAKAAEQDASKADGKAEAK